MGCNMGVSKFWDKLSVSFVALMALVIAYGIALSGCEIRPEPSSDEVFCVYADQETETGTTERFCCREFPVDTDTDCWRETR